GGRGAGQADPLAGEGDEAALWPRRPQGRSSVLEPCRQAGPDLRPTHVRGRLPAPGQAQERAGRGAPDARPAGVLPALQLLHGQDDVSLGPEADGPRRPGQAPVVLAVDRYELGPIATNCYVVRASRGASEAAVFDPGGDATTLRLELARM